MVSLTGQLLEGWCADSAKALSNKVRLHQAAAYTPLTEVPLWISSDGTARVQTDKPGALEDLQGLSRKNVQRVGNALAEKVRQPDPSWHCLQLYCFLKHQRV